MICNKITQQTSFIKMFCHDFIRQKTLPLQHCVDLVLFTSLSKVTKLFFKRASQSVYKQDQRRCGKTIWHWLHIAFLVRPFRFLLLHWKLIPWSYCRLTACPVSVTNSFKCSQDLTFKKNIFKSFVSVLLLASCLTNHTKNRLVTVIIECGSFSLD